MNGSGSGVGQRRGPSVDTIGPAGPGVRRFGAGRSKVPDRPPSRNGHVTIADWPLRSRNGDGGIGGRAAAPPGPAP